MIYPAQLYKERLKKEYLKSWYSNENMFYNSGPYGTNIDLPENNYTNHHFVSVDKDNNLIGYISYDVDWGAMAAYNFGIISFRKGTIEFVRDVYQVIVDIFEKYHFNSMRWLCYADNPAIRGYRNFIKKHGGRECAYYRQDTKLLDGKLHDTVGFQILAEEWKRR